MRSLVNFIAVGAGLSISLMMTRPASAQSGCEGVPNGWPCDAGTCLIGECFFGSCLPIDCGGGLCDDGNPCTISFCLGCECTVIDFTSDPCDDGNPCTINDVCVDGACTGGSFNQGAPCDDGDPCTTDDVCADGVCTAGSFNQGAPCDDGDPCTVDDFCDDQGACQGTFICEAACCFPNGACGDIAVPDCVTFGGTPQAGGSVCASASCSACPFDMNGDGVVNAADLAALLGNWGPCAE